MNAVASKFRNDSPATELIKIFREHEPPIIALVDENGIFIGTILKRQILKHISTALESEKSGAQGNPPADLGNS